MGCASSNAADLFPPPRRLAASRGQWLAREAEAWLRENLTEPLTITDLCQAVQASERTLHAAFRKYLGTTPKAHLKTLRLDAARRDLNHAEAGTRVTDVALFWGFLHFGWFSHDYRRSFGETPSDTLRRARRTLGHAGPALVLLRPPAAKGLGDEESKQSASW